VRALDAELGKARRARAAQEFHAVAESLRFLAGADVHSARDLETLDARCRVAWEARGLLAGRADAPLGADTEDQIRTDLLDVSLLWVDLKRNLAGPGQSGDHRETIDALLAEAEELLGPCPALARERRRQAGAADEKAQLGPPPDSRAPWEHIVLGRSLLRSGELGRAAEELERAVELRPNDLWANFYLGACAYRQGQYAGAVHWFGVAVALAPSSPECYFNRALAYAACGQDGPALRDYDRALALAPPLGAAALNRGALHYRQGHFSLALADLERALLNGAAPAATHYNLALVHLALRDQVAARRHLEQALRHNPAHAEAQSLKERLLRQ
jgi:tetratricopeptide (TPR) repeat protein